MSDATWTGIGIFLPPSPTAFLLSALFVGWTSWTLASRLPLWRDRAIALPVWCAAILVAATQLLSLIRQVHWPAMLALTGAGALFAWRWSRTRRRFAIGTDRPVVAGVSRREWALIAMCALPMIAYGLWSTWLILASSETMGDNLTYHLPRLGYWLAHQSVAPFLANDPRTGSFPPNGNILQLFPVLFLRTERLSALTQLGSLFGTSLAIFAAGRDLGGGRVGSALAAFCWFTIPTAVEQATTSHVDLIVSFFTMATAALALASVRRPAVANSWTCLAAAAVALGTKPQTLALALPSALVAIRMQWGQDRARTLRLIPAAVLAVGLLSLLPYAQNAFRFGSAAGMPAVTWVVSDPGLPTLARNLQLVLAPLNPESRLQMRYGRSAAWSLKQAVLGPGLGLLWLIAAAASATLVLRGLRRRPDRIVGGLAFVAAGFGLGTLFVFRHQPSIVRFMLPAAATLTPLMALALSGLVAASRAAGILATLAVGALGTYVLLDYAEADLIARRRPVPYFELKSKVEIAGPNLTPLAQAIEDRAVRNGPGRLGVITPQTYSERILHGRRFANVLVPLSYQSNLSLPELDRLRLDAIVMDTNGDFRLELFDHPLARKPMPHRERWRLTDVAAYDEDFLRGYRQVSHVRDFEDVAIRLGQPGSGWRLDFCGSYALLFARAWTPEPALGAFGFVDSSGQILPAGDSLGVGTQAASAAVVFAAQGGRVRLGATLIPSPALADREFWLDVKGPVDGGRIGGKAGPWSLPLELKAGRNVVGFRVGVRSALPDPERPSVSLGQVRIDWAR